MIKFTVLYPATPGARFDVDYYLNVHMPLSIRLLGSSLRSVSLEMGLAGGTPEQPAPFVAIVGFAFDSVEALNAAIGPHIPTLQADIPNYTDISPVFQIGEVKISR